MKKLNSFWAILVLFLCVTATSMAQLKAPTATTLFETDFNTLPTTFTAGDYDIIPLGAAVTETTVNTLVFGNGSNQQRVHIKTTQAVNTTGTYSPETADDAGATTGAISLIKSSTNSGGAYIITPEVTGPCDITVWLCSGVSYSQTCGVYFIEDNGTPSLNTTTTVPSSKYIKKYTYQYTGTAKLKVKFLCGSTQSSSNTNLYIYNIKITDHVVPTTPSLSLTSGNPTQTVYQTQTITPIVYQYGGSANAVNVVWTGTANSSTAPDGVTVSTVGTNVTIAGALSTLGSYGYSITATDGTNTTAALVGTLNTKTTTKYKMAYVTNVTAGAPAAGDLYFINGFTNNPGNDGFSKDFDLTYINATDTGIDYSIYDVIVESSIPSSASAGLAELKTKCLSKPFVNMKEFQLQVSAWNWAVPSNTTATTMIVADAAKTHPLFSGITFSGAASNEIILTLAVAGNMAVNISSWVGTPTPAVPTTLSTTKDPSSGVSTGLACYFEIPVGTTMSGMTTPTSAKQVVFGLSEANYNTALTADAITIAVNAAKYVMTPSLISLTSGSIKQTVTPGGIIANIVYTYISTVTSTNIVWTGTASSTTAPDGVTVTTDATAKTVTISGAPTTIGIYGYSVSATDGSVTPTLSGTLTVSTATGIQSAINSKTVVSKEFFDITGKKVSEYTRGILIEKSIYTDGSNSYKKIFRADL